MRNLSWLLSSLSLGVLLVASCGGDSNNNNIECGDNTMEVDGVCVGDDSRECATGTVENASGDCVPDGSVICETGTTFNPETGSCDADITGCASGTILVAGECRDPADVEADIEEAAEPNDVTGTPGSFMTPFLDASVTIAGCIEPFEVEGETIADLDSYVFSASGPMLLDISVDGFGGAAGAFQLVSLDAELLEADYMRLGINLSNDTSQRQVFLPKAGDYLISFGDSRSFFAGPAGGPGACYLASITQIAVPAATPLVRDVAATGTFTNNTQFFSFTATAAAVLVSETEAPNESALVDSVLMVNDVYRNSNTSIADRDLGDAAANIVAGLADADAVIYVVDPVVNLSLSPVDFTHLVTGPAVVPLPADGSTVSVPNPDFDGSGSLLSFTVANDGDVKFLDLDASSLGNGVPDIDWFIRDSNLDFVTLIGFEDEDGLHDGHFQFENAGVYYLEIRDFSDLTTDPYDLVGTQVDYTPTAVVVGTPLTAQALGASGAAFYTVSPGDFEWWSISGTPTDFLGDYNLDVFSRESGQIGEDLPLQANFVLDTGLVFNQVINDGEPTLLMVTDTGESATATFELSIANQLFTDLGALASDAPINQAITAADAETFYLATSTAGEAFQITITGVNGFDPILVAIDSEGETEIDLTSGADTTEVFSLLLGNPELTFAVRSAGGVSGDYNIDITSAQVVNLSAAPAAAIPDNDVVGLGDVIANADVCTIAAVQVAVDISHTFRGDLEITLTSAAGTSVILEGSSDDSTDDYVGTYPTTLTPDGDLSTLVGEDAVGNWTLSLVDTFSGDAGSLNSWGVDIVCQ